MSSLTKLTLYHFPGACSLAPLIALTEAGADFEIYNVDLQGGHQRSPEFLAVNPKGRVPALIVPGKGILTENVAILAYVAQTFPEANLAPTDPFKFAKLQAFNSYLSSTVHVAHGHLNRGHRWSDDPIGIASMKAKVPQNIKESFDLIEAEFFVGPYVLGETFSVADAYLFTVASWLEKDSVDIETLPKIKAHRELLLSRPSVQRAIAK